MMDGEQGVWHLANREAVSWAELATQVAERAKLSVGLVEPCAFAELAPKALRPRYSVLGSARGALMPTLEEGLEHYFQSQAA